VATYDYVDENNQPLFRVVRSDPKGFWQERSCQGGWVKGLGDTRRVLYQLPAVRQAVTAGEVIYIVEGEKDVHALERAGVVATCNPGGAGKWRPEYVASLAGAVRVVIVRDRDDVGRHHAQQVHASIVGHVGEVTVVEPAIGKDAADHLAAGRTVAELVSTTVDIQPSADALPQPLDWHQVFARTVDDEDWLVRDFWPARRAISVVARHKAGKSLLLFYVTACLARGLDPWTHQPREPVTVGYFDHEMTEDDVHERAIDFGLDPDGLDRFQYYLLPRIAPLDTAAGGRTVLGLVHRDGLQVVVFDTFSRVVVGEENLADTIAAYNRHTATPLKAAGIASARLDHVGHTNQDRARGTSSKGADVDVGWVLTRGDANSLTLDHHGVSRLRWVGRQLHLMLQDGPPARYVVAMTTAPDGTKACIGLLDRLGIPTDWGRNRVREASKEHGEKVTNTVLGAAIRGRREDENLSGQVLGQVAADPLRTGARTGTPETWADLQSDRSSDRCGQVDEPRADLCPSLGTDRSAGLSDDGHPELSL
jgi:hypothetical protein